MNTRRSNKQLGQSGQGVLEAILIISALFFVVSFVASEMKSNETVSKLVKGPWQALSGMISYGVWQPPAQAAALHPLKNRVASQEGEAP